MPYTTIPNPVVSSARTMLTMIDEPTTPEMNAQVGSGVPRSRLRMPLSRRSDSPIEMFVKQAPMTPNATSAGM